MKITMNRTLYPVALHLTAEEIPLLKTLLESSHPEDPRLKALAENMLRQLLSKMGAHALDADGWDGSVDGLSRQQIVNPKS